MIFMRAARRSRAQMTRVRSARNVIVKTAVRTCTAGAGPSATERKFVVLYLLSVGLRGVLQGQNNRAGALHHKIHPAAQRWNFAVSQSLLPQTRGRILDLK
jgi:hypothetical protein